MLNRCCVYSLLQVSPSSEQLDILSLMHVAPSFSFGNVTDCSTYSVSLTYEPSYQAACSCHDRRKLSPNRLFFSYLTLFFFSSVRLVALVALASLL